MGILSGTLGYLIFLFCSVASVYFARKIFGSYLNVTSALALPYLIICTLQFIIDFFYPFFDFPCFFYWLILSFYISFTFILESLYYYIFKRKAGKINNIASVHRLFLFVAIPFLLLVIYDIYKQVSAIDINVILQDEFQDDFDNSIGGGFYSRLFLMICSAYLLGCQNKIIGYVSGIICLVPNLVVNTKGIILLSIIASVIIKFYTGQVTNPKKALTIGGLLGVCVFFASYLYEYSVLDDSALSDSSLYSYIASKMVAYLISGVQEFNYNILYGNEFLFKEVDNVTMAPLSNLLHKIGMGEYIASVNPIERSIGVLPLYGDISSNVNTYIGTLYLFNGLLGGLFLHALWMFVILTIKQLADILKSPFYLILYSLFMAGIILGWFEFYFVHTFWIYFIFMTIVFDVLFRKKGKKQLC